MSNDPKEPLLLDHKYDGIQELDNNLPRWWVWLFYITIIFAAVYLVYYHVAAAGDLAGRRIRQGNEGRRRSSKPRRWASLKRPSRRCSRPPTPPCWKTAARLTPNFARPAIARTAAASSART